MVCRWRLGVLAALATAGGCSTFNETHYFKDNADPPNYYRLHISGGAQMASSRYVSGYFDESAMDTYFGEFTQPEQGRFLQSTRPTEAGTVPVAKKEGNGAVQVLAGDTSLEDRKLLMLFTTNSDEIATGIQSLAQNEAVATMLTNIVGHRYFSGARDATNQLATAKARAKMLSDEGDRLVAQLADDSDQATVAKNLLDYANSLAVYLGGPGSFANLDDAAKWVDDNRARLEAKFQED